MDLHVMVAADGSESADSAGEVAVQLFGTDAHYTVVTVGAAVPMAAMPTVGITPAYVTLNTLEAAQEASGEPSRAERIAEHSAEGLGVADVEVLTDRGVPGPAICQLAAERDVDVIVVGAHDRGWLSRLLEPSTAHHIVEHAPCHVLVVRGTDDN